jgi:hypothetical protein
VSSGDLLSDIVHFRLRILQLFGRAGSRYQTVVFKVVEGKAFGLVSETLPGGTRIDRQLQTFVGVFLSAWSTGLVINYDITIMRETIDAIDASDNRRASDLKIELMFSVLHVWCGRALCQRQ